MIAGIRVFLREVTRKSFTVSGIYSFIGCGCIASVSAYNSPCMPVFTQLLDWDTSYIDLVVYQLLTWTKEICKESMSNCSYILRN